MNAAIWVTTANSHTHSNPIRMRLVAHPVRYGFDTFFTRSLLKLCTARSGAGLGPGLVRALRRTSTPPGLTRDGVPGMLQPPPDSLSPPAVPTGYVYNLRETGDAGCAWSSPQQSGTGPAALAPGTTPVSRRRIGKAVCVQRSWRRARADAGRRPPYGDRIYPPGRRLVQPQTHSHAAARIGTRESIIPAGSIEQETA